MMGKIYGREGRIGLETMDSAGRVAVLAEDLLDALERSVGQLDVQFVTHKVKCKKEGMDFALELLQPVHTGIVDRHGLKQITAVLKELQVIRGEVSPLERREREAKIESLRRGAGLQEVEDGETGVILLPERKI